MADVTEAMITGIGGSFQVREISGQGPRLVCTECAAQVDISACTQADLVLYADIHDCDARLWALPSVDALRVGKAEVPRQGRHGWSRWGRRPPMLPATLGQAAAARG